MQQRLLPLLHFSANRTLQQVCGYCSAVFADRFPDSKNKDFSFVIMHKIQRPASSTVTSQRQSGIRKRVRHVPHVLIWADGMKRHNQSFPPTDAEVVPKNRMFRRKGLLRTAVPQNLPHAGRNLAAAGKNSNQSKRKMPGF